MNFPDGTDISEHLPTLYMLAKMSKSVVEFGVRGGVSTMAIIAAGKPSIHYDISPAPFVFNYPHTFIQQSSLEAEIPICDLLFIDTEHTYKQLSRELATHENMVSKFIAMHDTVTFGSELMPAIEGFLSTNPNWEIIAHYKNNNGLTVLGRK